MRTLHGHSLELWASWHQEVAQTQSRPRNYTRFSRERHSKDTARVTSAQWPTAISTLLSSQSDVAVRKQQCNTCWSNFFITRQDFLSTWLPNAQFCLQHHYSDPHSGKKIWKKIQTKKKRKKVKKCKRGAVQYWRMLKYLVIPTVAHVSNRTSSYILNR